MGCSGPEVLQNTIMRGRDEHYKLTFGDLELKCSSDGSKYIEISERDTKTRSGESNNTRAFKPKMWSTPSNPEKCPVLIFEKYIAQQPNQMCNPDSPFYLSINYKPGDGTHWYKRQKMGKDRIGQIMKRISTQDSLQGRKTNHSARKTMITKLAHCDVPDSRIMQLSGHKNVQSLNSYKQASLKQQQHMSHILSSYKDIEQMKDKEFSKNDVLQFSDAIRIIPRSKYLKLHH